MATFGKIKWFDPRKRYGYIEQEGGAGDVFVHISDVVTEGCRDLREGQRVKFEVTDSPRGKKAVHVELA